MHSLPSCGQVTEPLLGSGEVLHLRFGLHLSRQGLPIRTVTPLPSTRRSRLRPLCRAPVVPLIPFASHPLVRSRLAPLGTESERTGLDPALERGPTRGQCDRQARPRSRGVAARCPPATPVTEIINEQPADTLLRARNCRVLAWLRAGESLGQALRIGVQLLVRKRRLDFGDQMDAAAARELGPAVEAFGGKNFAEVKRGFHNE